MTTKTGALPDNVVDSPAYPPEHHALPTAIQISDVEQRTQSAIRAWRSEIGRQEVLCDTEHLREYHNNISGYEGDISAVLLPENTAQVQAIVHIANNTGVPLYPVSTGKNWGLGSRLPVRDSCAIVDLSRMNRVREVNERFAYAVIEPGVTQGDLYEHISAQNPGVAMNVTGSARGTSIIGNALERGVGYFGSRADSLSGVEVVLGTGKKLTTGFGHFANAATTHLYRYGIGPDLTGLFAQSNFGIVTAAGFELMPKPDCRFAAIITVPDHVALPRFIDALQALMRGSTIQMDVRVGNRSRTEITLTPMLYDYFCNECGIPAEAALARAKQVMRKRRFTDWSAVLSWGGTRGQAAAARRELLHALRPIAKVMIFDQRSFSRAKRLLHKFTFHPRIQNIYAFLHAVEPLNGLAWGIPTDAAMKSVYWPVTHDLPQVHIDQPDRHARPGLLYCLPILPADGKTVEQTLARISAIAHTHTMTPYITLNMLSPKAIDCVISLAFDRTDKARTRAAQDCLGDMQQELIDQGLIPYRTGVRHMSQVVNADDSFWQAARDIKNALDPNGIIAPGRYSLT